MILRVKGKDGIIHTVKNILTIASTSQDVSVVGDDNSIEISSTTQTYDEWYSSYVTKKLSAMLNGGSESDDVSKDNAYSFTHGVKIYTSYAYDDGDLVERPYIKTIASVTPDSTGNIQLLPGHTLDVSAALNGYIKLSRIKAESNPDISYILEDINRCVWYLYHAFNTILYRLNIWDPSQHVSPMFPTRRLLGTLVSYQAVVSAWNAKVWRKSFLFGVNTMRENASFFMGYVALNCVNPDVRLKAVITNTTKSDTTKFYTVYAQGFSTNIKDQKVTNIEKLTVDGTRVTLDGNGFDGCVAMGSNWDTIEINIDLGKLNQGDYFKAAFSLSVSWDTSANIMYGGATDNYNEFKLDVYWIFDEDESNNSKCVTTNTLRLREITLLKDDGGAQ